ncbi:hypothetical protein AYY18_00980 [Morganella psychrotolerans]|uniref:DNA-binding protein n=1 Tax=Morganella psychrotolerans TaxID=368603 RepID=A0A1B8HU01_9GAMM|nr:hypothetical protein AYY18_00980 [Morganella psychrotolerans]
MTELLEKESPWFKTSELASRYEVKPHTIRLWAGNGKQRREGFPRPRYKSKELVFMRQDILDWENGKQFE